MKSTDPELIVVFARFVHSNPNLIGDHALLVRVFYAYEKTVRQMRRADKRARDI